MLRYDSVLFDLDGTLSASAPGITRSMRYGLSAIGMDVPEEKLTRFIGPPLNVELAAAYGLSDDDIRTVISKFRDRYETIGMYETEAYPGIREMLSALRAAGTTLAVASSKPEPHVVTVMEHLGLAEFFDFLCGSRIEDELANKTGTDNKAKVIARTLSLLPEKNKARIAMVGDTRYDILGAKANGLPAVGCTYGYGTREELAAAGANAIADTADGLRKILLAENLGAS